MHIRAAAYHRLILKKAISADRSGNNIHICWDSTNSLSDTVHTLCTVELVVCGIDRPENAFCLHVPLCNFAPDTFTTFVMPVVQCRSVEKHVLHIACYMHHGLHGPSAALDQMQHKYCHTLDPQ